MDKDLFGNKIEEDLNNKYSSKIKAPIYKPRYRKPIITELVDTLKTRTLIKEIERSGVTEEEKQFLIEAAKRHNVFNYSLIADYYAYASEEMQNLMEKSALIIIDFNKAIEYGYVKLSQELAEQYKEENREENA